MSIQASSNIDHINLPKVLTPIPGRTILQYFLFWWKGFFMRGANIWYVCKAAEERIYNTPGILGQLYCVVDLGENFRSFQPYLTLLKINSLKPLWAPLKRVNWSTLRYLCLLKLKYVWVRKNTPKLKPFEVVWLLTPFPKVHFHH